MWRTTKCWNSAEHFNHKCRSQPRGEVRSELLRRPVRDVESRDSESIRAAVDESRRGGHREIEGLARDANARLIDRTLASVRIGESADWPSEQRLQRRPAAGELVSLFV